MQNATGRYSNYLIFGKTAALAPEFAVEDLPLSRIAALVPKFAVKDLPLGRTLMIYIYIYVYIYMRDFWRVYIKDHWHPYEMILDDDDGQ